MAIRVLKSVQSDQSVVKKLFASFERDFIEPFVSFVLRKVEGLEGFKVLGMKCFRDFLRDLSSHSCHSC